MPAMTRVEVETLITVLANDGMISSRDLGFLLTRSRKLTGEMAHETGRRRAMPLLLAGALHKPRPGYYDLTEKGRIAAALVISRDAWLIDLFHGDPG